MTPIVNGLEAEFAGEVAVWRIDAETDEGRLLQQQYGVRGHPALVTLNQDNKLSERYFGVVDEKALRQELNKIGQ